ADRGSATGASIERIMDAAVYVRPCWGGFLAGGYETEPTQFDMASLPEDFSIGEMPLDLDVLRRLMDGVYQLPPAVDGAPPAPPGRHPDGAARGTAHRRACVGNGRLVASGCNVAGLSIAPAIGEEIARWIVDGRPSWDLGAMSIARFGPAWQDEERLRRAGTREYWHFYSYDASSR